MAFGQCKLCLNERDLRWSHFIPRSIISATREPSLEIHDPVVITANLVVTTSRHICDWVLCARCEQRFNAEGESWVGARVATRGAFPMFDIVSNARPISESDQFLTYEGASIPGFEIDKLAYLGLSIFWRSAAHDWPPLGKAKVPKVDLGSGQEPLRRFLLGEAKFPGDMLLQISLWPCEPTNLNIVPPVERGRHPFRELWLVLPGVEFLLFVGEGIPETFWPMCVCSSARKPIAVSKGPDAFLWTQVAEMGRQARHSGPVKSLLSRKNRS
jgi:hypothetical protein